MTGEVDTHAESELRFTTGKQRIYLAHFTTFSSSFLSFPLRPVALPQSRVSPFLPFVLLRLRSPPSHLSGSLTRKFHGIHSSESSPIWKRCPGVELVGARSKFEVVLACSWTCQGLAGPAAYGCIVWTLALANGGAHCYSLTAVARVADACLETRPVPWFLRVGVRAPNVPGTTHLD